MAPRRAAVRGDVTSSRSFSSSMSGWMSFRNLRSHVQVEKPAEGIMHMFCNRIPCTRSTAYGRAGRSPATEQQTEQRHAAKCAGAHEVKPCGLRSARRAELCSCNWKDHWVRGINRPAQVTMTHQGCCMMPWMVIRRAGLGCSIREIRSAAACDTCRATRGKLSVPGHLRGAAFRGSQSRCARLSADAECAQDGGAQSGGTMSRASGGAEMHTVGGSGL